MPKIDWLETIRCLERHYGYQYALAEDLGVRGRTIRGWKEFEKYGRVRRARNLRNSPNYGKVYYRAKKHDCVVYEGEYVLLRRGIITTFKASGIPYFDVSTRRVRMKSEFGAGEDREIEIQHERWVEIFRQITDCGVGFEEEIEETVVGDMKVDRLESQRIDLENRNVDYYITYDFGENVVENWNIWEAEVVFELLKEALREMDRMEVLRDFEEKIG